MTGIELTLPWLLAELAFDWFSWSIEHILLENTVYRVVFWTGHLHFDASYQQDEQS